MGQQKKVNNGTYEDGARAPNSFTAGNESTKKRKKKCIVSSGIYDNIEAKTWKKRRGPVRQIERLNGCSLPTT